MTPPSQRAVLAREPSLAPGSVRTPARRYDGGPVWMRVVPPVVTLAVMLWGISGSSYWRDESATLAAVQRPFGQLIRMLGHVDAVHGGYYILMWPVVRVAGSSPLATRFPSAVAMAVAAGLVAALGRRLVSPATGLAAGLIFAVVPVVSLYGQDARSYAMVTALAAAASYLLVRLITAGGRGRWLAGYWACLTGVGLLNFFGLLLIAAHAVTVLVAWRREGDRRARRSLALGWLAAAAGAVLVTSPVVLLSWTERSQLAWLNAPRISTITGLEQLVGSRWMPVGLAIILACGVLASAVSGRAALRRGWPVLLPALAVPWLAVPLLLLGASLLTPLYTFRYVLFCVPAGALLAGAGLAAIGRAVASWFGRAPAGAGGTGLRVLGWAVCAVALAVVTALGLSTQLHDRGPAGHEDNIRRADQIVAANIRTGDAVIYDTPADENLIAAYPYGMDRLINIAQYQSPIASGTLAGTTLPAPAVRQRIAGVSRLWVVEVHHRARLPVLQGLGLRQLRIWHTADLWLFLYATR